MAEAYVEAALASDARAGSRTPPSFRAPAGALEDSFYLASGRQLWETSLIRARTLIIRSERDFWSRPEDVELLREHLTHAREVQSVACLRRLTTSTSTGPKPAGPVSSKR